MVRELTRQEIEKIDGGLTREAWGGAIGGVIGGTLGGLVGGPMGERVGAALGGLAGMWVADNPQYILSHSGDPSSDPIIYGAIP